MVKPNDTHNYDWEEQMLPKPQFSEESKKKWVEYYNKLVDKEVIATAWMGDPTKTYAQKEAEFLRYKCEIYGPLESYLKFFRAIGIEVQPGEKVRYPSGEPVKTPN